MRSGLAEFRGYDPERHVYFRRRWKNQYRLTGRGLSVLPNLRHTYAAERLTVEPTAEIRSKIDAELDRIMAGAGIPRVGRAV